VQALSCLQRRPNFHEIISTTNQYSQTLAHLAILYDYHLLLRHLVDWRVDLAISDVNGLTALHFAYMKGDLHSMHILRRGGAPEAAKDKLGRIPSDLRLEGFGRGFNIDAEMYPVGNDIEEQAVLGGQFSAPDLDLDEDKVSGHSESDFEDDASDAKDPASIVVGSFADGYRDESGGGSGQIAPTSKAPETKRGRHIMPSPPSGTSISNISWNFWEAAPKPVGILRRGTSPTHNIDNGCKTIK
jgi:hypothetical protein